MLGREQEREVTWTDPATSGGKARQKISVLRRRERREQADPGRGSSEVRFHPAEWPRQPRLQEAEPLSHSPSLWLGGLFQERKSSLVLGHTWRPQRLGVGFQEHSITCPGQSPGEGLCTPLRPDPVPFTGCPPKSYLLS